VTLQSEYLTSGRVENEALHSAESLIAANTESLKF